MHLRDLLNMEIKDFELERKRIEYLFQGQDADCVAGDRYSLFSSDASARVTSP